MDRENIVKLRDEPYKVSWKADGTRYMMLIDGRDRVSLRAHSHYVTHSYC